MLKSCPKRLAEQMPKTGRFLITYLPDYADAADIGKKCKGDAAKAYEVEQYKWHDGKLYEWDDHCDEWDEVTVEDVIGYHKTSSDAMMFTRIPEVARTLEPILTLQDMEVLEEAKRKRDHFAKMYGGHTLVFPDYGATPCKALEPTRPH